MEVSKRCLWLAAFQLFWFLCLVESYPDGVNLYKDWLRGKNEDDIERMIAEDQFEAPRLFFYRTPSSFTDLGMGEPLEKRTVNRYKNMMLNKDSLDVPLMDDVEQTKEATRYFSPRITPKRSPGAILSWAIPAANRVRVISTNYRPPGINRPAA
ncbi:uncharacterized protein LOC126559315 [Anopheles maculipalpis]|uniref:uncharacterized protein LOC126559315 n=1 Tax=Anopheles maculipalpis TaxID=1496333 RepID=UPI002159A800|nr:uncharacterized protein LOC126559315 [Anopheles maculipalpis]